MESFEKTAAENVEKNPTIMSELDDVLTASNQKYTVLENTDNIIRIQLLDDGGYPCDDEYHLEMMNGIGANCDSLLGSNMSVFEHPNGAINIKIELDNQA